MERHCHSIFHSFFKLKVFLWPKEIFCFLYTYTCTCHVRENHLNNCFGWSLTVAINLILLYCLCFASFHFISLNFLFWIHFLNIYCSLMQCKPDLKVRFFPIFQRDFSKIMYSIIKNECVKWWIMNEMIASHLMFDEDSTLKSNKVKMRANVSLINW